MPAKKEVAKKKVAKKKVARVSPRREDSVDDYIAGLEGWQAEVVAALRALVRAAAPKATEAIKWGQPVFEDVGPFAYIKAFRNHVNFGFWRGNDLPDAAGLLRSSGTRMGHVKIEGPTDLPRPALTKLVRQAVALNHREGDPTKRR
jgi:hypothetical protein